MVSDKKSAVRVLISLALLGGIYLVSYFAASGNIDAPVYTKFDISSDESKLIGSLIILVYILGSAAILSILGSTVYKLTLKR
jgi:drug/metabolite transporter superfamily protein YnfA